MKNSKNGDKVDVLASLYSSKSLTSTSPEVTTDRFNNLAISGSFDSQDLLFNQNGTIIHSLEHSGQASSFVWYLDENPNRQYIDLVSRLPAKISFTVPSGQINVAVSLPSLFSTPIFVQKDSVVTVICTTTTCVFTVNEWYTASFTRDPFRHMFNI
jgi:hypothetical protein